MVWVEWLDCWIRPVSCIYVKRWSRALGRECGDTFIIVNINYILSTAYDVLVPCRGGHIIHNFRGSRLQCTTDVLQCVADENQCGALHYGQQIWQNAENV